MCGRTWRATFNGSVLRLYVNGTLADDEAIAGSMAASTGVLRIGGNSVWAEWFAGLIDEVGVLLDRALTGAEIQQDMASAVIGSPPASDTTAASAPSGLSWSTSVGSVALSGCSERERGCRGLQRLWLVDRRLHARCREPDLQPSGTSHSDSGLAAGMFYYRVPAEDAAGNVT